MAATHEGCRSAPRGDMCLNSTRFAAQCSECRSSTLASAAAIRLLPSGAVVMSRQYNMYNVQLSEFWKQRVGRENLTNTPYLFESELDVSDTASQAPSQAISRSSRGSGSRLSQVSEATKAKIAELEAKLDAERAKREEVERQLKAYENP
uniref:Uncharacterized protein n=1 Tax=Haptolina brevifila TaxID=156173 RepID=A0A7S2N1F2_9EUKA